MLDSLSTEDSDRQSHYVAWREYYDGDHNTQLTERQRRYLQVKLGDEFNANHCPTVVDAVSERLHVTGFKSADSRLAERLWGWWQDNRMDALQGIVHLAAVRDGDAYLIAEWDEDEGRPVFSDELAYDGSEGVRVHYSSEQRRRIAFASKWWETEIEESGEAQAAKRCNLYYPDRIEKYVYLQTEAGGHWQPYREDPADRWPIPWVDEAGKPLGVPVVHFRNKGQGYNYGQSELKSVVPLQNALNKAIIDLLAAADTTAFRIFWMIGDDPSGLEIAPGSWVFSKRPPSGEQGAAMGFFPGENLQPLISFSDAFVMEIARVSRTPISFFQVSGHRPAEGTLKQEEVGLVAKVKRCQVAFGNAWEDAMRMAVRLYNAFGAQVPGEQLDAIAQLDTLWADPETRNARDHLEALKLKAELGVPVETLWGEMGYSAQEIAEMRAQRGEEMMAQSNLGGELLRAFEGGYTGDGFGGQTNDEGRGTNEREPEETAEAEEMAE